MSLSRAQQILLKRAQAEAGIADADYRAAIATVSAIPNATSSKDPRLTDAHLDAILAYFEAIHWQAVDAGTLRPSTKPVRVFRARSFWAGRNARGNTSRDRYTEAQLADQIAAVEFEFMQLGFDENYLAAIRRNIRPYADWKYLGALTRTLKTKQAKSLV
jgi:hypothetical protein